MKMSEIILENAKSFLGTPYVWGGESMSEGGFDCSGYVYNVLKASKIICVRDTAQGYYNKYKSNTSNLNKPGALIFFGKSTKSITHVAINIDGVHMYESMGNKSNTKSKPGKGVVKSLITRRKDLVAVCTPFKTDNIVLSSYVLDTTKEKLIVPQPTLRRGDMGVEVNRLQKALNRFTSYGLVCDGIFGNNTYKALKVFQSNNKLVSDGIYGNKSYNVMRGKINGN